MRKYTGLKPYVESVEALKTDPGIEEDLRNILVRLNQEGLKTFSSQGGDHSFIIFTKTLTPSQKTGVRTILESFGIISPQFWDIPKRVFGWGRTEVTWGQLVFSRTFPDHGIILQPQ